MGRPSALNAIHHRHKQPDCHRQTKKGPREPLILRPELRSSDPTHAGGHSPEKGAGGCGSLGLSPRRVLRGYPIGLGSDTGRPWPEPQLETLNSRWWAVCTEWKAGVPVQEARSPQQPSPRGDWPALYLARGLQALQLPTCALCPNSHCLTAKKKARRMRVVFCQNGRGDRHQR